ncbi:MAG TPA: ABC transporter permease subunit [Termitinemataceae bacterium]|nr:ABC transporter permease subunit [Termitinemataceae bacterium]HOM23634.1 ABC transporter permease subunit [Termitinemataceae bacterium]HPP99734.1 ABC transporter permease subunit [Termitinemataceae bacterium]
MKTATSTAPRRNAFLQKLWHQRFLLALSVPFVIWLIIFCYIPLVGWVIAFQDYKPHLGFFNQEWVGLKHFEALFKAPMFYQALWNTLGMSVLLLVFGFTSSIGFALLLNELTSLKFKKFVQTVSYLPHFVSWVIVASIITSMLSLSGPINEWLVDWGILKKPFDFMAQPDLFWWIVVFADMWKETGWNAIIYLAAMSAIDPQLYEAALVDGANRLQRIWYITLPGIRYTVITLLILSIGNIINIGFERQYLLGNAVVAPKALVLDKYALDFGIGLFRYSYGTAIGIFKSGVSIVMLVIANQLAHRFGERKIF